MNFEDPGNAKPEPLRKKALIIPINIDSYKEVPKELIPDTESLKDTYKRVVKYLYEEIQKKLINNNILISAHGNSIRALCKYLI